MTDTNDRNQHIHRLSRRGFLGAGVGAVGAAAVACASPGGETAKGGTGDEATDATGADAGPLAGRTVAFDGPHQAGVQTASQANLALISFDLNEGVDRAGVRRLMNLWTEDARALCTGQNPVGGLEPEMVQIPANLSITVGFGEPLFDKIGLTDKRPEFLHDIPAFEHDDLDPRWGQTDLVLQICGDDAISVAYAMRHMIRSGVDYAHTRWFQRGLSHADGSMADGTTPRNLFGQKDGTVNPHGDEEYDQQVWIDAAADGAPDWLDGGSVMVARRIARHMDEWEKLGRSSREVVIGRDLPEGAPLSGGDEFTEPDLTKTDETGLPVIDPKSHMALSRDDEKYQGEQRLLRRPYTYDLEPEPGSGDASNSGLVFLCYQRNPDKQFSAIQRRLDGGDRLNEWITHIGSSVYALPPGVGEGGDTYWGQRLLEA